MMRKRRLLLATAALSTTLGCGDKKRADPLPLPGNPKGSIYDAGPPDAGTEDAAAAPDAPPTTAIDAGSGPKAPPNVYANTKGSFYDDGLVKPK